LILKFACAATNYLVIVRESVNCLFSKCGSHDNMLQLLSAVRLSDKFSETAMFKSLGAKLLGRSHPSCATLESGSNAYWECYVRHNAFPIVHRIAGTCRMGKAEDKLSVVDSHLK